LPEGPVQRIVSIVGWQRDQNDFCILACRFLQSGRLELQFCLRGQVMGVEEDGAWDMMVPL
jgi:hypothetical protein